MFFENVSPGDSKKDDSPGFLFLRTDMLDEARRGPVSFANDLDISLDLFGLVTLELEKYGTDSSNILADTDIEKVIKVLKSVLRRLGIILELPFRNFTTFRSYWISNGASNSWQARRDILETLFHDCRGALDALEEGRLTKPLTNPADQPNVDWPEVDNEIRELRRKYESAVTPQDFRALGTNCIGVLEAVGMMVYDPLLDLRGEEKSLAYDRIKDRLNRYIERRLPEDENEELRKVIKATIALANRLKHRTIPDALMAGIAADTTIYVTSMIRRLSDPSLSLILQDEAPF